MDGGLFSPHFVDKGIEAPKVEELPPGHTASEWQSLTSNSGHHFHHSTGLRHSFHAGCPFMPPSCRPCTGLLEH